MIEQQVKSDHGWEALKETSHCKASSFLMLEGFDKSTTAKSGNENS